MSFQVPAAPPARSFDVVTVVWGEEFVRLFLEVGVPNQSTPGNLGALPAGSRYRIFTAPEDAAALRSSAALRRVEALLPVEVVSASHLAASRKNRFSRMTACHRQAVVDARSRGAALIFLCADHVLSEGAFAAVVDRHRRGARASVCAGLRLEREGFLSALRARGGVAGVPPRQLVSLALDHLHPSTSAHFADGAATARTPIAIYWRVPGEGLLARCFHLHPLMIDPVVRDVLPDDTIDGHFVRRACPVRDQVHVVADSDELVMFELSRRGDAAVGTRAGGVPAWRAATMMARCDSHQEWYWRLPIRLHAVETSDAWRPVERESARFADRAGRLRAARRWMSLRHLKRIGRRDGLVGKPLRRIAGRSSKRLRRTASLLAHAVTRRVHRFRKRAARAGRRFVRRARAA